MQFLFKLCPYIRITTLVAKNILKPNVQFHLTCAPSRKLSFPPGDPRPFLVSGLNVIVRIPMPPNTAKCTTTTAAGKAKYEPETSELVRAAAPHRPRTRPRAAARFGAGGASGLDNAGRTLIRVRAPLAGGRGGRCGVSASSPATRSTR